MKNVLIALASFLLTIPASAQTAGYVYGIDNASSGVFWFSKMEVATGTFTHLQQMPWAMSNSGISSCVSDAQQVYYYCSTTAMYKIYPLTGLILATVPLNIPPTAEFYHMQYNPCDSMIYGVVNDYPNSIYFAKYNTVTDSVSFMGALPGNMSFCGGCMAVIDPVNQLYILQAPNELVGISIVTGQTIFNTPIINLSNESFGHIAWDCATGHIVGTSASASEGRKYLAIIDPQTGIVSHISSNYWTDGIWKPSNGGDCIDNSTGIYYYSGTPDFIIGVDVATGDTVSVQPTGYGNFLCAECFSTCACQTTAISEISQGQVAVFPNPVQDFLTVTQPGTDSWFVIRDVLGREVLRIPLKESSSAVSVSALSAGTYFWTLSSGEGEIISAGRFIRE